MLHRKVLIADDDPDIRRLVAHWLEAAGYDVQHAVDGREALEAAHRDCPHFLITDWDMPGLDGIELCRCIREERFPHYIYTVLLTAHHKVADMILALETGADDLLTKPIVAAELLARLRAGARVIELENQLVRLAGTDPLTAVPNRWVFFEHFERELARARRYELPLSCVLCDIDFFKNFNDTHGHIVGDIILKAFAQVLNAQCRSSDHLCRYGGEEFCILLPDTDEAAATAWAERIRFALRDLALPCRDQHVTITASFGVAGLCDGVTKAGDLLDNADSAMRMAKHTGRDRVVKFSELRDAGGEAVSLVDDFRTRLKSITARDVMTSPIARLTCDQPIADAIDLFLRSRISSAPVVTSDGQLAGIVSEKDLLAAPARADVWRTPVSDVMKTNVVCYDEETPAITLYDFLCRVTIRRVVIVKQGVPTGVVSRAGLLRWLTNSQSMPIAPGDQMQLQRIMDGLKQHVAALENDAAADGGTAALVSRATNIQELTAELLAVSAGLNPAVTTPPPISPLPLVAEQAPLGGDRNLPVG
jgi:two-component system, cell cycle response regulator